MRIQSNNRLAHYQVEFQELQEQTAMLNAQLPGLQQQIASLEQYLSCNAGDRKARQNYSQVRQRYNSTCSSIRRNAMRMQTLQRQIAIEGNKIAMSQQRMAMSGGSRGGYGRRRYY